MSRILPDGNVDLVVQVGPRSRSAVVMVAGPDSGPRSATTVDGGMTWGIRLRAGVAATVLLEPSRHRSPASAGVSALRDGSTPLHRLWGRAGRRLDREVARALCRTDAEGAVGEVLIDAVASAIDRPLDDAVLDTVAELSQPFDRPGSTVDGIGAARCSGADVVGERQLRRRFVAQVGYGPSTYRRIRRFRRFVDELGTASAAQAAVGASYADQAHAARETRRLSGLTVSQLARWWHAPG